MDQPPTLLLRLSMPKKRENKFSDKLKQSWMSFEGTNSAGSKQLQMSQTSLTSGLVSQTKLGATLLPPISKKSTPNLLDRILDSQIIVTPKAPLLNQLSSPEPHESTLEKKSTTSLNASQEMEILMTTNLHNQSVERNELKKVKCHGTNLEHINVQAAPKPVQPSGSLVMISLEPNHSFMLPQDYLMEYHPHNGIESSKGSQLISIRSSSPCTVSNLMMREKVAWESLKLSLQWLRQIDKSRQGLSGQLLSDRPHKQLFSSSLIAGRSRVCTASTLVPLHCQTA